MRNQLTMILLVLVALMTAPAWAQSYPAADAFSGSGALSSSWTQVAPTGLSYPPVPLVKSSGTVVPNTAASWGMAVYTGETFTADQYAQVKFVAHATGGWTGPCVRMNAGAFGYCYAPDQGAIALFYDGQWYQTLTSSCPVPASGDTVQISATGTTITCTDVTKGTNASVTDSTYWVGSIPGVVVDTRGSSVYALTSFQADCVPTCGLGTVATPTFSPTAGSYSSAQTVTISDATSGATIHYTTDGSTPTASSTTYSSPITVSSSETVKAIGIKSGYANSAVGSAAYTISSSPYPAMDAFSGSGALSSSWTQVAPTGLSYPPVPLVKSSGTVVPNTAASWGMAVYTGETFTADQYAQVKFVAHSTGGWTGPCVRMSAGAFGYCYAPDQGAIALFYDGQWYQTLTSSCPIPASGDTVQISATGTTITCTDVTKGTNASVTDSTYWVGSIPGVVVDTRGSSVYALTSFQADCIPTCGSGGGTVATPTFSPGAGTYTSAQTVTISDATSGATIHYTTDGSTPTAGSTTYTAPISVSTSETVKAIGVLSGSTNSAVSSAAYTINLTVATPTFSPGAGTYTSAQSVTISDATSGATIYYTIDGSTPTTSSTTYSSPISVSVSETVKAIGVLSGYTNSAVGSAAYTISSGSGHTWYVRPDGGIRYSTNWPTGVCDGTADAAPVGSTPNQHCAFNDVRMLYADGSYTIGASFPGWGWIGAGGDTYIIRGSIGTGVSYRIGQNSSSTYCDSTNYCWGIAGDPYSSGMPAPPSGTAAHHTRILGENYASCHSASAKTQLHGGYQATTVLSLGGASYVDVACLDITDFSSCGKGTVSNGCGPTDDYAKDGIEFNNTSTNDTLTDIHIHGMATHGMFGPTGGGVVLSYVDMLGNALAGWDTDDGTTGVGSLLVQNFNISWNGCTEEYPVVDSLPYGNCYDQNSGGYGDGFGTRTLDSPAPGWQVHFDQGTVSYNTQDGLDALHIGGPGSTMTDTRVLAFGNMGNQLKVGGATATIQNSVIVGNCRAMSLAIPGTPSGYNSGLSDFCRPSDTDTAIAIDITPGDPGVFQGNTIYSEGKIGIDVEYATGDFGSTNTLKYNDNIFVGFEDPENGENPTPIYSNTDLNMLTNPGASWTNNSYFGYRSDWTCPAAGESAALCSAPDLTDMTYHDYGYGNMAPATTSSPVVGAGVTITGLTTDYKGTTRANPPTIGACETTATCP